MFYTLNDDGMITNTDITSKIAVLVETFKTSANEDRKNVLDHFERECIRYFEDCVLGKNIHDLSNEDWFVLSDIQKRIDEKWKKGIYENEAKKDIYNLRLSFGNMLKKYGFIYNQKTNSHEKRVSYRRNDVQPLPDACRKGPERHRRSPCRCYSRSSCRDGRIHWAGAGAGRIAAGAGRRL